MTSETPDTETPVFDFSTYSHREARARETQAKKLVFLNRQLVAGAYPDEETFDAALARFDALIDDYEQFLSRILVSVPRAWLVDNAPPDLNWTDPASLGWIRQEKYAELSDAAAEARRPESVSKNSEPH